MAISPDSKRIVIGGGLLDSTVKVWDGDKGAETLSLKGHIFGIRSVSFSADGKCIVSCADNALKVWAVDKRTPDFPQGAQ
jgi:WD40 repeat protein